MDRFKEFTVLISKISRLIHKIKIEEMSEYGLKGHYVSSLYYVYKYDGTLTAKELCDICYEDKGAISRSLKYLEGSGYIKSDSNSAKKYKSVLHLTPKGREVAKDIVAKIDGVLDVSSIGVSDSDRDILYKSLSIICDNLTTICDKYGD